MGVRHPTSGQVPSVGWSPCPSTGLLAGELLEVSQLSPSGWGCRCSDCQEATVLQEPPCVTQTGIAPDPRLGSSPRALALHMPSGPSLWGACWRGWLFVLPSHGCSELLPGTVAGRGAELLSERNHLPPLKGKAPAPPLWAAGMLLCGSGYFSSSFQPSFDFLPSPSIRSVTVFRWPFVYTSRVRHHHLCLIRSIKAALAKGQRRIYKYPSTLPHPTRC